MSKNTCQHLSPIPLYDPSRCTDQRGTSTHLRWRGGCKGAQLSIKMKKTQPQLVRSRASPKLIRLRVLRVMPRSRVLQVFHEKKKKKTRHLTAARLRLSSKKSIFANTTLVEDIVFGSTSSLIPPPPPKKKGLKPSGPLHQVKQTGNTLFARRRFLRAKKGLGWRTANPPKRNTPSELLPAAVPPPSPKRQHTLYPNFLPARTLGENPTKFTPYSYTKYRHTRHSQMPVRTNISEDVNKSMLS